jgi:hypothetical protein
MAKGHNQGFAHLEFPNFGLPGLSHTEEFAQNL